MGRGRRPVCVHSLTVLYDSQCAAEARPDGLSAGPQAASCRPSLISVQRGRYVCSISVGCSVQEQTVESKDDTGAQRELEAGAVDSRHRTLCSSERTNQKVLQSS